MTDVGLKLPWLTPARKQFLLHVLLVFGTTFGTQLLAGLTNALNVSTVLALLSSAAAAAATTTAHYLLGLIPTPYVGFEHLGARLTIPSRANQVIVSFAVVFLSVLGAQLLGGALHIVSLPTLAAVVVAAITAAATSGLQAITKIVPVAGMISEVTVTFKFEDAGGAAQSGFLTFAPSTPIKNGTDQRSTTVKIARLAADGTGSVVLAAGDDVGTSPTGLSYLVTPNFFGVPLVQGIAPASFSIVIGSAMAPTVDLSSLTAIPTPPVPAAYIPLPASPEVGQVLTWNGSAWIAATPS